MSSDGEICVPNNSLPMELERLEALMQQALKTSSKLKSARGKRIDEGKGYLSIITSIEMQWSDPGKHLPAKVAVKIPSMLKIDGLKEDMQKSTGEQMKSFKEMEEEMSANGVQFDFLAYTHRNECMAYEMFCVGREPPVPMPRYFYSEMRDKTNAGMLIMEDVGDQAKTPEFADGLTLGQLRSMMKALASLHAFGLNNPSWNADSRFMMLTKDQMKGFLTTLRTGAKALRQLPAAKEIFSITDEQIDRVCDFDEIYELLDPSNKRYHPVVVHGDLWTNNFLYQRDSNGVNGLSDELVALVDWQVIHPGPPGEDFARVMTSSVDYDMRRKHEFELIDEYYKHLQQLMAGTGVAVPYTADDVKNLYRKMLPYGVAIMIMQVPGVLTNPAASAKYTDEQKAALVWRLQAGFEDILKSR